MPGALIRANMVPFFLFSFLLFSFSLSSRRYGVVLLSFSPLNLSFFSSPSDHDVTVRVRRSKGSKGTVRVFYKTTSFVERLPFLPANTPRAKENQDFTPKDNHLDFPEGKLVGGKEVEVDWRGNYRLFAVS